MIQISWVLPIFLSGLCGLILGIERMIKDKPASIKTQMLVCIGACIYTLVSVHLAGPTSDVTRIISQIVTGVGFLGAGVVLRNGDKITGITTAAIIWVNAAIGIVCGIGYGIQAVLFCVAIGITLYVISYIEKKIEKSDSND